MKPSAPIDGRDPDVPALVYTAFPGLRHAEYWLLRISDEEQARAWLARPGVRRYIHGGNRVGRRYEARARHAVALAFTWLGLKALGFEEDPNYPFPSAFREGMLHPPRSQLLADHDTHTWRWGDTPGPDTRPVVHVLLAHYAVSQVALGKGLFTDAILSGHGFQVVQRLSTCPSYIEPKGLDQGSEVSARLFEPFGFRDGIAQPVLRSVAAKSLPQRRLRERLGAALYDDRVVADGEFVLGHHNEYGDLACSPNARGWKGARGSHFGDNGSFLVARQIRQDVPALKRFEASAGGQATERIIGRRRDGTPLVSFPKPTELDAFRYRGSDGSGFQCPIGAHVRRSNPRDMQGRDSESGRRMSKLHRLLRRARVYSEGCTRLAAGACGDTLGRSGQPGSDGSDVCGRGLFFMALNADLDRQFEFVQSTWIANPQFGGLHDESDPLLGGRGTRALTSQGATVAGPQPVPPALTFVVGGAYFFLPGIAALDFLVEGGGE